MQLCHSLPPPYPVRGRLCPPPSPALCAGIFDKREEIVLKMVRFYATYLLIDYKIMLRSRSGLLQALKGHDLKQAIPQKDFLWLHWGFLVD